MSIRMDDFAQPACRLPIINNPTIYMPDHSLLAAVNYADARKDTRLFLVDVEKLTSTYYPVPDNQHGAYGFTRGADGNLYLGFFGGALYRFDVAARTFARLARPLPDKLVWGGGASKAGRVYMGVYPTGEFCEYDIASGDCRVLAPLPKENLGFYARGFVELPDGRMLVYIDGARPTVVLYNPASRRTDSTHSLGLEYGGATFCGLDSDRVVFSIKDCVRTFNLRTGQVDGVFLEGLPESFSYLRRDGNAYLAVGLMHGRIYEFDRSGFRVLKDSLRDNNIPSGGVHHIRDRVFACMGDNGLFTRFDADSGVESHVQVDNESDCGMQIQIIRKQPGAPVVVGSHFINSQIFRLDASSGECVPSRRKIVTPPGQINCATFLNGVCYLGVYTHSLIAAYRPDRPFACNENPRTVAEVGHAQNRPVGIVNDGRFVYMASKADYRTLGGSIAVLDPVTERLEVYRDFVPTHNPTSLFYDGQGRLVGTTQTFGDMRTCPARDAHAVIFLWDTRERKTILTAKPWESDVLSASALSPDGVMIGFAADRYYLFSTRDGSCRTAESPVGAPAGGFFIDNNRFLGCHAKSEGDARLFLLDTRTNKAEDFGPTRGTRLFERLSETEVLMDYEGYRLRKMDISALLSPSR